MYKDELRRREDAMIKKYGTDQYEPLISDKEKDYLDEIR